VIVLPSQKIWRPVQFNDSAWLNTDTTLFDKVKPSWLEYRKKLNQDKGLLSEFNNKMKREHAIETGIVERLYDLSEGVTETFINEGFNDSLIQHGDTENANLTMNYIRDQFEAIEEVFSFVKEAREMSSSFIRTVHMILTSHQRTTQAKTSNGDIIEVELIRGDYKKQPNNPQRLDGTIIEYCPPFEVPMQIHDLIAINKYLVGNNVHVLIRAAFFHHSFTTIHPFQDGNGRVVRLLTSFILIKEGLFPFTVTRKSENNILIV
jgi:Uncharacterized conserved protein